MTKKKQAADSKQSAWLRYLSGKLSDSERYDLEQRLANDPDAQIALEAMAQNDLSPEALQNDLSDIKQRWKGRKGDPKKSLPLWVNRVAAVLFIGFGIWAATQYYQDQQNSTLYAHFFETDSYLSVRGENIVNNEFSLAMEAYDDKSFESSFIQFQHINDLQTDNNQARLYAAMSAMQLGKNFEAKHLLDDVINQTKKTSEEASAYWFLALVYLQEDNEYECKKHLRWLIDFAPNSQWAGQAKNLMGKIE